MFRKLVLRFLVATCFLGVFVFGSNAKTTGDEYNPNIPTGRGSNYDKCVVNFTYFYQKHPDDFFGKEKDIKDILAETCYLIEVTNLKNPSNVNEVINDLGINTFKFINKRLKEENEFYTDNSDFGFMLYTYAMRMMIVNDIFIDEDEYYNILHKCNAIATSRYLINKFGYKRVMSPDFTYELLSPVAMQEIADKCNLMTHSAENQLHGD